MKYIIKGVIYNTNDFQLRVDPTNNDRTITTVRTILGKYYDFWQSSDDIMNKTLIYENRITKDYFYVIPDEHLL